jgi:hypothetical protein
MTPRSLIVYPAVPPSPSAPSLSETAAGSLGGRTEYYRLSFVTPDGEGLPGPRASLILDADNVTQVAAPAYPYPFAIYGYNVYAATTAGSEVLQNGAGPVLAGDVWMEPVTGLVTGSASPPTSWASTTLTFGRHAWPTKIPRYMRNAVRKSNVAASGQLETIYEHTDQFTEFNLAHADLGPDIDAWNTFVTWAERGGIFTFYPDMTVGGAQPGIGTNYTLWDSNWNAAYLHPGAYTFKMQWRVAT